MTCYRHSGISLKPIQHARDYVHLVQAWFPYLFLHHIHSGCSCDYLTKEYFSAVTRSQPRYRGRQMSRSLQPVHLPPVLVNTKWETYLGIMSCKLMDLETKDSCLLLYGWGSEMDNSNIAAISKAKYTVSGKFFFVSWKAIYLQCLCEIPRQPVCPLLRYCFL